MHRGQTHQIQCVFTTNSFFIKNSLCYLPLVHIWQSWTFKASLLRYMPIIHHFCLKVFTFANVHVFPYMTIKFIYSHNIQKFYKMQFEIQEHLLMFLKKCKKPVDFELTSNRFKIWLLANRAKLLDTKSV